MQLCATAGPQLIASKPSETSMPGQFANRKPAVLKKASLSSRSSKSSIGSLRSRREAAYRSRETVRGYVRLLQKNPEPKAVPEKSLIDALGAESVPPKSEDIRERPNEIVTITIRDPSPNERRSSRVANRPNYALLNSGTQSPTEDLSDENEEFTLSKYSNVIFSVKRGKILNKKTNRRPEKPAFDSFVCQRCRASFSTVEVFCRHFELKHCKPILENAGSSHSQIFTCERCSFITQDEYDFEKHSVMHIRIKDLANTKSDGRYHCHRCSFSARSAITICHHLKKHTEEKISQTFFACTDCTARFVTRNEVLKHQSLIHGKRDVFNRH